MNLPFHHIHIEKDMIQNHAIEWVTCSDKQHTHIWIESQKSLSHWPLHWRLFKIQIQYMHIYSMEMKHLLMLNIIWPILSEYMLFQFRIRSTFHVFIFFSGDSIAMQTLVNQQKINNNNNNRKEESRYSNK